jgi:hypothetical protein
MPEANICLVASRLGRQLRLTPGTAVTHHGLDVCIPLHDLRATIRAKAHVASLKPCTPSKHFRANAGPEMNNLSSRCDEGP